MESLNAGMWVLLIDLTKIALVITSWIKQTAYFPQGRLIEQHFKFVEIPMLT